MVLGFISSGLMSKKMHAIEHALAIQIKQTPRRIRSELRALVHEFLLLKVKRVYKDEFVYTPTELQHSQSCPDLRLVGNVDSPGTRRRRALSECVPVSDLIRIQSDTDLNLIDKERTFNRKVSEQSNLLLRVANALSGMDSDEEETGGIDNFSDEEILASESTNSTWTSINQKTSNLAPPFRRRRAFSEVKFPFGNKLNSENDNNFTWYGLPSTVKLQQIREEAQNYRSTSGTLPVQPHPSPNLLSKLKNTLMAAREGKQRNTDVEKQEIVPRKDRIHSVPASKYIRQTRSGRNSLYPTDSVLEQTSVADFLRVLTDLSVVNTSETSLHVPQRKFGTASLTPPRLTPPMSRRVSIRPPSQSRRGSLISPPQLHQASRRFSLRPVFPEPLTVRRPLNIPTLPPALANRRLSTNPPIIETNNSPPPPYTPFPSESSARRSIRVPGSNRRFSLRPVTLSPSSSPVKRQVIRSRENKDDSKEVFNEKL